MLLFMSYMYTIFYSAESGIKQKGKYLGVTEKGTKGPEGVKTGLDHMKILVLHTFSFYQYLIMLQ